VRLLFYVVKSLYFLAELSSLVILREDFVSAFKLK